MRAPGAATRLSLGLLTWEASQSITVAIRCDTYPPVKAPTSDQETTTTPRTGFVSDSVQLGWSVLTSAWTTLIVGGLIATSLAVGAHMVPQEAGFKELLATQDYASARAFAGLGLTDAVAGWLSLLLYLTAGLNLIGLYLRYGMGAGESRRDADSSGGAWVTEVHATLQRPVHEVVQRLPAAFSRTRRRRNSDVVVSQRGLWDGGWVLVLAGALAFLGAVGVDRGGAFEGRVTLVPGASEVSKTEFRTDQGLWIKRPNLGLVCLPADPADPARTRQCRLPTSRGGAEVALGAGQTVSAGDLQLRQFSETPRPALISEGVGPSLLLRAGGASKPPQRLNVAANGNSYRVDAKTSAAQPTSVELTSFFSPDGPFVVASVAKGPRVLMTPALEAKPAAVPGTDLFLAGVPWWRVELRVGTDPGRYLRYTALALLLLGLLLMVVLPEVRIRVEPVPGGGACRVSVRSANRRGVAQSHLAQIVKLNDSAKVKAR